MLPVVIVILCLVAAVAAASGHFMGRLSRLRADCRLAFEKLDKPLKARQDLALELIEQGAKQGLLQRQVRESLQASRHAAGAARAWAAGCPDDVRALARVNDSEAQLARALQTALQSVRAEALASVGLGDLLERLTQADQTVARRMSEFNQAVSAYNRSVARAPLGLVARLLGFQPSLPLGKALTPTMILRVASTHSCPGSAL
jgi:hypothetical protein